MKNFINKISGKKALVIVTVLACICAVLEIITAIRLGNKINFTAMCVIFSAITIWACAVEKKEKEAGER